MKPCTGIEEPETELNKEKVISKLSCLCLDFMNDFNFNCYVKMFHCTVSNLELTIRVLAIVAHLKFILA